MAYPIFPVEWLEIKRTGSIASIVGPAVTNTCIPSISFLCAISFKICSTISRSSGNFPFPVSPQARCPTSGSMTCQPYFFKSSMLSCVTGFSYILVFIAGAISFGHRQARAVVVNISSAMPWASLAITFALAGATTNRSARFASSTCSTWNWKFRSNVSVRHLFPVNVSKVTGVINCNAFSVMITCTSACCFFKRLARFAALYAAILPLTPNTTVFPFSIRFSFCIFPFLFYILYFSLRTIKHYKLL